MTDYNVEGRLITKDDWENWMKMKEEYSNRCLSNTPEPSAKKESRYPGVSRIHRNNLRWKQ